MPNGEGFIASPMALTFWELQGGGNCDWNMHRHCIWDGEANAVLPIADNEDANFQHQQASHFPPPPPVAVRGALDVVPAFYAPQLEYSVGIMNREVNYGVDGGGGGGGFNIWQRTYFSLANDLAAERMTARSSGFYSSMRHVVPRCQTEACGADLSGAKHYHRRHKVCAFHAKAFVAIVAGLHQRFCQQCSRFHVLSEFDEAKRSCRKRLADHNRRRRKHQPPTAAASKNNTTRTNYSSKNKHSRMKPAGNASTIARTGQVSEHQPLRNNVLENRWSSCRSWWMQLAHGEDA